MRETELLSVEKPECYSINNFFTCFFSMRGRCHVLSRLNAFSGVVLSPKALVLLKVVGKEMC